jgi:hypothetical protein
MTTTTNSVSHTYASAGTFNVAVTITDNNGVKSASPSKTVTVPIGVVIPVNFGPTTTIVGNTTFIGTISGSSLPFTCTWGFGDGTSPVVAACTSPVGQQHTYIASGTFTASFNVTDSAGNKGSLVQTVTVEPNPSFIGGQLHWTHHLQSGTTESFTVKFANPTTFTVDVTISIDVFRDSGIFVVHLQARDLVGPGFSTTSYTNASLTFTPTVTGKYHFVATITYAAVIPTGLATGPQTTTINGTDGTKSGSFAVV